MRIASIDLGTNTFNLLIAEIKEDKDFDILFEKKLPVKLGKGGIHKKIIAQNAFERGIKAMKTHNDTIEKYNVNNKVAFATSAMRDAENGEEFRNIVKEKFDIDIQIIDGQREAELIYYGVKQSMPLQNEPFVILDIGGGSNEFIICNNEKIFWKHSFNLGIARLLEMFSPSDPIKPDELERVNNHFEQELKLLSDAIKEVPVKRMIGASGTFDTLASMINFKKHNQKNLPDGKHHQQITLDEFYMLYDKLLPSTLEQRKLIRGLEPMRIEMIVLATHFIKFVIEKYTIKELYQSKFSLKEGVIHEIINK
jgi:exopolyphosphatase/guanosine-5'-triphosphate,3'-diphosphate pyrophosphatase